MGNVPNHLQGAVPGSWALPCGGVRFDAHPHRSPTGCRPGVPDGYVYHRRRFGHNVRLRHQLSTVVFDFSREQRTSTGGLRCRMYWPAHLKFVGPYTLLAISPFSCCAAWVEHGLDCMSTACTDKLTLQVVHLLLTTAHYEPTRFPWFLQSFQVLLGLGN